LISNNFKNQWEIFMTIFKTTPVAIASLLCMGLHMPSHAQSNSELRNELQSLKERINQLETQLRTPAKVSQTVDSDEFNRIRSKVEALDDNTDTQGFKGLKVSGMLDPTFVYNQRQNNAGFVFLNNFDGRGNTTGGTNATDNFAYDNSYFGMAVLDLQKETDAGQRWRLTLAPHKSASSGYNLGSIVHEASVSLPIDGPNNRLIAGQLPDWTGYEYYFSNLQPLITHNMLFDFTIPSFYSGVGMEFTRGQWVSKFMVGNINESRRAENEKNPGISFRSDYAKGEFSGFGFAGSHTTNPGRKVTQIEMDGYFTRGDMTLQGQIGTGQAEGQASNVDANGKRLTAKWTGISTLVGYKLTPRLQLVTRGDYIWNSTQGGGLWGAYGSNERPDGRNGVGLPMAAQGALWSPEGQRGVNRYALALGMNYLISSGLTPNSGLWNTGTWFKAELRYDGATGRVFYDTRDHSYHKGNLMLATSLVFAF
jgi:hypothetical protein